MLPTLFLTHTFLGQDIGISLPLRLLGLVLVRKADWGTSKRGESPAGAGTTFCNRASSKLAGVI